MTFMPPRCLVWVGGLSPSGQAAQPFPSVERLVANRAGEASVCQRRQPPKAVAEGQRLQRLASPATIGHRVGRADRTGMPDRLCAERTLKGCGREQTATHSAQRRA